MKVIVVCVAGLFVIGITLHRQMKPAASATDTAGRNKSHHHHKRNSSQFHRGPLIWQDEFDFLDYSKWQHMITGWRGSQSFQYYANRSENIYVRDGVLFIKPTLTADRFGEDFLYNGTLDMNLEGCNVNWGGGCIVKAGAEIIQPIQSARIHTAKSFSFTYGSVEARARMPRGDWIWPAIWMMPKEPSAYGPDPRSGEIDITEVRSNANFTCNKRPYGKQLSGSTLHWGPSAKIDGHRKTHWEKVQLDRDYASDFHLFRVNWTPKGIQFYTDDELIGEVYPPAGGFWELGGFEGDNLWKNSINPIMTPFDRPFYLILNVAVGGNMFSDWCENKPFPKPWNKTDPVQMRKFWEKKDEWYPTWNAETDDNAMQVDYIRVYALPE